MFGIKRDVIIIELKYHLKCEHHCIVGGRRLTCDVGFEKKLFLSVQYGHTLTKCRMYSHIGVKPSRCAPHAPPHPQNSNPPAFSVGTNFICLHIIS